MSLCNKNWKIAQANNADADLAKKLKLPQEVYALLLNRGLNTEERISSYLSPALKDLHDPFLLPGIKTAVKRLIEAYYKKDNILIYGDYDADGIISVAILYNFLRQAGLKVDYYIPDRFDEGYDINIDFVKKQSSCKSRKLIICVDCGTNAEEVKNFITGNANGIDIIVCDHHEPSVKNENSFKKAALKNKRPNSSGKYGKYIIINPKIPGSSYPFKNLSGAGVTFKFIIAALRTFEEPVKSKFKKDYLTSLLDLAAVSTVADIMPLVDENRIIVKKGLLDIKKTKNEGLRLLIEKTIANKDKISAYDIGFIIAPRLNASGRIKSACDSLKLLIEGKPTEFLSDTIEKLNDLNEKRQKMQLEIFNEIKEKYNLEETAAREKIIICSSNRWSEGIIGIVASNIVKNYNIPAILFKEKGDILKGSARSIENFDLYSFISTYSGMFLKFGGHRLACGIKMKKENFDRFKELSLNQIKSMLKTQDIEKIYYYDMELSFNKINAIFFSYLEKMEPFGQGNPKPLFLAKNCLIVEEPFYTSNNMHLILKLENEKTILNAIIFNCSAKKDKAKEFLQKGKNLNILYYLNRQQKFKNPAQRQNNFEALPAKLIRNKSFRPQLIIQDFC